MSKNKRKYINSPRDLEIGKYYKHDAFPDTIYFAAYNSPFKQYKNLIIVKSKNQDLIGTIVLYDVCYENNCKFWEKFYRTYARVTK